MLNWNSPIRRVSDKRKARVVGCLFDVNGAPYQLIIAVPEEGGREELAMCDMNGRSPQRLIMPDGSGPETPKVFENIPYTVKRWVLVRRDKQGLDYEYSSNAYHSKEEASTVTVEGRPVVAIVPILFETSFY